MFFAPTSNSHTRNIQPLTYASNTPIAPSPHKYVLQYAQLLISVYVVSWLPGVIHIFADRNTFKPAIRPDKLNSFFSSVTTLISNQV